MIQERIKTFFKSITLPVVFEEQNRGFFKCCEPLLVLAGNGLESWKNDISSAWVQTSDPSDYFSFEVHGSDGQPVAGYVVEVSEFPNQAGAFYTTVKWIDILNLAGPDCYSIVVTYGIGGYNGSFVWGQYELKPYTIENALGTARLRVVLNLNQTIENINFTGSNVQDCIRFRGQIDKDQPNTEIKNLTYRDRTVKTIVNELLQTYLITTDPYTDEVLNKFEKLYLLSGNEIFLTDHNAHSNSYEILDVPASMIEGESPEREKIEKYSRQQVFTCKLGDRNINKRTFY